VSLYWTVPALDFKVVTVLVELFLLLIGLEATIVEYSPAALAPGGENSLCKSLL